MTIYSANDYAIDCETVKHNEKRLTLLKPLRIAESQLKIGKKTGKKLVSKYELLTIKNVYFDGYGLVVDIPESNADYASRMEGLASRRMELENELESMGPERKMINKKEYEKIRLTRLIERLEEENALGVRSAVRRSATIYDGEEIKLEDAIRIIRIEDPYWDSDTYSTSIAIEYEALETLERSIEERNKRIESIKSLLGRMNK